MNPNWFANAEWFEVLWTLEAFLAIIYTIRALWDLRGDLKALKEVGGDESSFILARADVLTESLRLFVQLCFAPIGIRAMLLPASPGTQNLGRMLSIFLLMAAQSAILANTLLARRLRRRVERAVVFEEQRRSELAERERQRALKKK